MSGRFSTTLKRRNFPSRAAFVLVKPENVIGGTIFLYLREDAGEVIRIEEGFAAGIGSQGGQGILRSGIAAQIIEHGLSGIRR